jgi:hypothetical protein
MKLSIKFAKDLIVKSDGTILGIGTIVAPSDEI